MSTYGLMADLHLHAWSAFSTVKPDGMNSRLAGLLDEITRCVQETKRMGGSSVVLAGDIFHVRGSVAPSVLNAVRDRIKELAKDVTFYIMPGNHDLEGKESTRLSSAVTALEGENVLVLNKSATFSHATGFTLLVPWVEGLENLIDTIEHAMFDEAQRAMTDLILHAPIDGVITGLPHAGLNPTHLAGLGFKRVFAGHYHNHKVFPGGVHSIGALAHHTWSDVGSKAGFLVVEDDKVHWFKSHLPEFIDLSQLADVEPEEIPLLVDQNFVRVKVESGKVKDVEAARKELLDMGAKAVIVQAQPKPPERAVGSAPTVAAGASLEVSVSDFVKAMTTLAPEILPFVQTEALSILSSVVEGD